MFVSATQTAERYTCPVVACARHADGNVTSEVGAFVVINEEGWIVTAAHLFNLMEQRYQCIDRGDQARAVFDRGSGDDEIARAFRPGEEWLLNAALWWGKDGVRLDPLYKLPELDLALGKLNDMPSWMFQQRPKLKDPDAEVTVGKSLCRLGFPLSPLLNDFETPFDEKTQTFKVPPSGWDYCPTDALLMRTGTFGVNADGISLMSLETDSPGMHGQSGGPIYDSKGILWGVQTSTLHWPVDWKLPRDPRTYMRELLATDTSKDRPKPVMDQGADYAHLGFGVHPRTLVDVLNHYHIEFDRE